MTETYDIVAVETDSPEDVGCTIAFDRPYTLTEGFPVTSDSVCRAVEDAYNWWTTDRLLDLEERTVIGHLTVENRHYVDTEIESPQ